MAKEMSALELKNLKHTGAAKKTERHAVGGVTGLYIQVTALQHKSWLLRFSVNGNQRELGLGSYPDVSLKEARDKAIVHRAEARMGIDPIALKREAKTKHKKEAREAKRAAYTFKQATEDYMIQKSAEFSTSKQHFHWLSPIKRYAYPVIENTPVHDIDVQDILQVLEPIWASRNETAVRLRARLELILAAATVKGYRKGDNPARWVGNLKSVLPKPSKVHTVRHMPAIPHEMAPAWFAELRKREGIGSRALEFLALTGVRSGEVRGAEWEEFDLKNAVWLIPAERMKMSKPHRVPLSTAAVELLEKLPRMQGSPLVFTAPRGGMLSNMTLSATMKRMHEDKAAEDGVGWIDGKSKDPAVPHGLRSTFRDWAASQMRYDFAAIELALAHAVGSSVTQAYFREDLLEQRRPMMQHWAEYLTGTLQKGKVVQFG